MKPSRSVPYRIDLSPYNLPNLIGAFEDAAENNGIEAFADIARQLRAQVPNVYEHLVVEQLATAAKSACGKVWTPGEPSVVVGRCPECEGIAEGGWTS